jgi:hypothetical protein
MAATCRASRQLPRRTPRRARQPPRTPRRRPDRLASAPPRLDRRLADRTAVPTASPTAPPSRPLVDAAPPSTVPAPVSRCSSAASTHRRRVVAGSSSSTAVRATPAEAELGRQCHARGPRTLRRPRPWAAWSWATPYTVHLGPAVSAQLHPVKFYYFLIYSIHCKFKNLCRIDLNSENYETNFVGKV